MARSVKRDQQVQSVTSVGQALSADIDARTKRYAIQMIIRVVCFGLALVTPHPWRWIFVAGAVFLPYIAVIGANTPSRQTDSGLHAVDHRRITQDGNDTAEQPLTTTHPEDPDTEELNSDAPG